MKKLFIALMIVAAWASGSMPQRTYTAEQIANLTFNDVTRILRTIVLPATVVQTNNRQYSLDMIFNLVYDSTNRALRISAVMSSIAPDSLHEWSHAWLDTALAKHYASKAGLAVDFYMRGVRGDTFAKFTGRHGNVVAWIDTCGGSNWLARVTARADSADTATFNRLKLVPQGTYVPWCTSINSWGAKGFITGWYPDTGGMVKGPPYGTWYTGVALRERRYVGMPAGPAREIWSIRVGGYKPAPDSSEAWSYPMLIVDPGVTQSTFQRGQQRIYAGTPFYWMKIDTVCTPDTIAWVDMAGQLHCQGVDLIPQVTTPPDLHKLWTRDDSLFWNDAAGVPRPLYPAVAPPVSAMAFGDTNAYYASAAAYGPGRDSIGGHYFSGANAIQAAINAASTAASVTNKKTVYLFEGVYAQNCSLKSNVNLVGAGMQVTVIKTGKGNTIFTSRGASNFTVRDLSLVADSAVTVYLADSLTTMGCKNVLYYNFMCYSSPLLSGNDMIGYIKVQAGDSVKFINCQFGLGTRNSTATGPGWAAINATMTGGMLTMDKVSQQTAGQVYGMTITKSGGIIDISNSSFVCVSGTPGIGVILAENQNYENWCDWFTNCDFTGDGNAPAFRNTGTGYLANIFLVGCTLWGTYQPSVGASQNNHVSGKIFNASGNPMTQLGWGGILSGTNSPELNLEWQATSTGDRAGFHFGGIAFDTLINVLSNAPHEGYMQYKDNGTHDTLFLYADGAWRPVYPAGSAGTADSARYVYSVPNGVKLGFSTAKNFVDVHGGNHTWDIGAVGNAPDTVFCSAVVGASDLHLYSSTTVQMQGTVAAIGSQGTYGAVALDTQRVYGRMFFNASAGWWSALDTIQFALSSDTLKLDSYKNSAFLDLRELTVLFKSGWMLFDQIKPATNDSASSSLGSASDPYGSIYGRVFSYGGITMRLGAGADTGVVFTDASGTKFMWMDTLGQVSIMNQILGYANVRCGTANDFGDVGYSANKWRPRSAWYASWFLAPRGDANNAGRFYWGHTLDDTTTAKGAIMYLDSLHLRIKLGGVDVTGGKVTADTVDFLSTVAAGAQAATLLNSPVLGDPTTWIAIKVGGVTKYVPAW